MLIMTHSSVSTIVTFLLSCRVTILSLSDTRAINNPMQAWKRRHKILFATSMKSMGYENVHNVSTSAHSLIILYPFS